MSKSFLSLFTSNYLDLLYDFRLWPVLRRFLFVFRRLPPDVLGKAKKTACVVKNLALQTVKYSWIVSLDIL